MPTLEPLIPADQIAARIATLADEIRARHHDHPLLLVGVMKGSFLFHADLVRALHDLDVRIDFLGVHSYAGTSSTGAVRLTNDLKHSIDGQHVVLVEDIVDTGLTMQYLRTNLATRNPRSVKLCSLLHKPARSRVPIPIDYLGFTIEDRFVVGYGLD